MKRLLKTLVVQWLDERALRLPEDVRKSIAAKLKVDIGVVRAVEEAFRAHVIKTVMEW